MMQRSEFDRSVGPARPCSNAAARAATLGRTSEADAILHTLDATSRERYIPPYATALVHAGSTHRDEVYAWLQRAYESHDVHLALLVIDPKWDAFRTEPQFEALLMRCGFTKA